MALWKLRTVASFCLSGEPGLGKTAFLAHLAKEGQVHHFVRVDNLDQLSPVAFVQSVGAQLAREFGPWVLSEEEPPPGVDVDMSIGTLATGGIAIGGLIQHYVGVPVEELARTWIPRRLRRLAAHGKEMAARFEGSSYTYDGLVADLDLAWRHAHEKALRQTDAGDEPAAIADCVRYALFCASVNSLAGNSDPSLVARAVETGIWAVEHALSVARLISDPGLRATMFAALLSTELLRRTLMSDQRQRVELEGLAAAAIGDEQNRTEAVAALAPQLSGEMRDSALREALAAALAIGNEQFRFRALVALLSLVTDSADCLRSIRHAISDHVRKNLADKGRHDVLAFCAQQELFGPPILSSATLATIAGDIVEVCDRWEWL